MRYYRGHIFIMPPVLYNISIIIIIIIISMRDADFSARMALSIRGVAIVLREHHII